MLVHVDFDIMFGPDFGVKVTTHDITQLSLALVGRLCHYFGSYKTVPGKPSEVVVGDPYPAQHAREVILAAVADYEAEFSARS